MQRMLSGLLLGLACLPGAADAQSPAPSDAAVVAVTAARMVDVLAGKVVEHPQVVIADGRIVAVGKAAMPCLTVRAASIWATARCCRA